MPLFVLGRRVVGKGVRETPAGGPAGGVVSEGETAGGVDECLTEGHTGARTHRAEPVARLQLALEDVAVLVLEVEHALTAEIGVLDVAFETDHEGADLVVVANLGAAE